MLSSLASLPSGLASFVSNRRKTFTWVAGTVGGAYLLGQWGLRRMGDMAEKARVEGADRDNLARRFNLNQDDCQFTVLALLPTLSGQLMDEMDVEACSKELATLAQKAKKREREQREEEERLRLEQQRAEEEEQRRNEEESNTVQDDSTSQQNPTDASTADESTPQDAVSASPPADSASDPPEVPIIPPASSQDPPTSYAQAAAPSPSLLSASKLSAEAPAFSPSFAVNPAPEPEVEVEKARVVEEITSESTVLSRSWAEVVAKGDGKAEEVESESTVAVPEPVVEEQRPPAEPEKPERTRAELWEEIKILSFTRTLTSLYLLTLLTLQTHVQLSLLGRASYVSSVLSSLPPTPSPDPLTKEMNYGEDLELALYGEKVKLKEGQVGVSKETERRYLTCSWWLLHKGWKEVSEKVKRAVEEVVGPMGLKSPVVYGELSTLLGQIRHKVDYNADGSLYDFSSALFPPTPADEHETLLSGGISLTSGPAVTPELRRLLNETVDTLESGDCTLVRKLCLDRLFSLLVGQLETAFVAPPGSGSEVMGSRFEDVSERTTRLAGLLPTVARLSGGVLNGVPNEYLVALEDVRELTEFSAIIYSSFDRDNVRGSC